MSESGAEPESGGKTRWTTSVPQIVNVGADLEGGAELDVHGGHEMLLLQQQEGLSVDLLRQELGGELLTTCQDEEDDKRKFLCYFKTAMICGLKRAVIWKILTLKRGNELRHILHAPLGGASWEAAGCRALCRERGRRLVARS